ncbi:stemmadenine O-acetyltransferase-like [Prosopis cineraria]|uniref:stemmadenine O-acetyltransferase-like n=1 Tax=Prosopis cineraria TaxID=364024 RepID=UPI00240EF5DD|nr:stemmadenine O-acetyltransferase-like [Prosopis cineraria]
MKVEFVSKQIIKPSSPTPQNLGIFKLSFIDQLAPVMHTRILYFYPNIQNEAADRDHDRFERLKTSLSETLTLFYHLAGRMKDNAVIECNDEGVEFCEARVHGGFLSDILKQPDADSVHQFVPIDDAHLGSGFLAKVQVNLFDCGGLAIGVSLSHKIADASTIGSFIKAWSCAAVGCMTESMLPKYILGSLYPSMDFPIVLPAVEFRHFNCITRRFVFDSSKITKLKATAASKMVENPTRVEAVLALIWKCVTIASRTNLGITKRPSMVSQFVNIRKRTSPPLPETCVGNFLGHFMAEEPGESNNDDSEMNLQGLVIHLRKGLEQFTKEHVQKLQEGNNAFMTVCEGLKDLELVYKEGIDFYGCTSWCRFAFYEADFGWGKPKWVSIPSLKIKNSIILTDMSDGKGIEAWVTLSEQDMALMETNLELLEFASLNPSII